MFLKWQIILNVYLFHYVHKPMVEYLNKHSGDVAVLLEKDNSNKQA
jgi:hypothetical protein